MEETEGKICPKCGMQLVGDKNYCMGCGVNVDLKKNAGSPDKDSPFVKVYGNGTGYGGGPESLERLLAAQKMRERRKKKNILSYGGRITFLFVLIGVTLGITLGVLALKWSMVPKSDVSTYYKNLKVTDFAGVTRIDPPKAKEFEDQTDESGPADLRNTRIEDGKEAQMSANVETSDKEADPEKQFFLSTLTFKTKGNAIVEMDETEVWNVKDLNPNSVQYVVNHLNYKYEEYRDVTFLDCEISQNSDEVKVHLVYRDLDVEENVLSMLRLKLIEEGVVVQSMGKTYVSMRRMSQYLEGSGWKTEAQDPKTVVIHVK